jgi:HK97 family phage major capsid protein
MDIKIPVATAISTATAKSEGDGTGSNLFTESEPTLAQITLSAFMAGVLHQISWELAQDVPAFQEFAVGDMLLAQTLYEENLFINGTGTGQAQGLKGNTAAGVTGVVVGSDGYASELMQASYTVQGLLKGCYFPNSSWLMNRSTGVLLRKAQATSNLFLPVWTRENGKDLFHGFPVVYSTSMDAVGASKTPVLFGDFATAL